MTDFNVAPQKELPAGLPERRSNESRERAAP
jgi:hypothetical protein